MRLAVKPPAFAQPALVRLLLPRLPAARLLVTWLTVALLVLLDGSAALATTTEPRATPSRAAIALTYAVVARYPHDSNRFTQGLELVGDTLYESSGLYGQSFITHQTWPPSAPSTSAARTVDTAAANTASKVDAPVVAALPANYFGEGLTVRGARVYVLSWREQRGFIFDRHSLQRIGEFRLQGEGWGLTHNDRQLILSDGSATLQFIDPESFAVTKTLPVADAGRPLANLNELEWVDNKTAGAARILANIWRTDTIAVIDPADGRVTAYLDLHQLYPAGQRSARADVLNGIAYDARDNTLLVTGKFWPYLYRIRLLRALP